MSQLRSKEELDHALLHLRYECWMLTSVTQALSTGIAREGWILNALLESFVIHLRALTDFFYPSDQVKPDDMLAAHYFPKQEDWETIRPPLSDTLKNAKRRAHKEIAHLTYARLAVTTEAKPWAFVEITDEIQSVIRVFSNATKRKVL